MDRVPHQGSEALEGGGLGGFEGRGLLAKLVAVDGKVDGVELCGGQGSAVGDSGDDALNAGMAVGGLGRGE